MAMDAVSMRSPPGALPGLAGLPGPAGPAGTQLLIRTAPDIRTIRRQAFMAGSLAISVSRPLRYYTAARRSEMSKAEKTVDQVVCEMLAEYGVEFVFGMRLYEDLDPSRTRPVNVHFETSA